MTSGVFGVWDAPMTDDLPPVPTPVGERCLWCHEEVQEGDNGLVQPNGLVVHRECSLRGTLGGIGHQIDHERYCRSELGPDAGLSYRASALMVWNWWQETGGHVTEEEREYWKRVLSTVTEGRN